MTELGIPGVILTALDTHADARGRFVEVLRASDYPEIFVQSNHSRSEMGVLRGLHYHRRQADLWYVVAGRAQVGLADLRTKGSTLTATLQLSSDTPAALFIPAGVAHGFLALTEVDLIYWVSNYYDATDEHGIVWNDPTLAIEWAESNPILSDRDRNNSELEWESLPTF